MMRGLKSRTFAPGAVVYRQGSIGHSLYFIVDGVAEVVVQPPHGDELVLERLERGEYFGETPAGSHSRRMVTVRAGPDRPLTVSETEDHEQFKQRLMNSRTFQAPPRSDGVSG
jgi:signal-transduction protein with cAMP-binding, CBS, and nucleotidyltransferase domain